MTVGANVQAGGQWVASQGSLMRGCKLQDGGVVFSGGLLGNAGAFEVGVSTVEVLVNGALSIAWGTVRHAASAHRALA